MVPKLRFPGFQDTWNLTKISDNFEFKNGLNKEKEFFGKGTPIINFTDVYHLGKISEKDIAGKVTLSKGEIDRYRALVGDVFFTRTSESIHDIGMTSVLVEDVTDCVFSGFVLRARPKNKNLYPLFNAYSFKRHSVRKEIVTKSSMTTRALTSGTLLNGVLFSYPTINEQQKIASFLSSIDEKISQLEKKKTLLEIYKRGIMQKIFSQELRFKDENGQEFPDWKVNILGDLSDIRDGTHDSPKYIKSGFPLITSKNLSKSGGISFEDIKYISDEDYNEINKRSEVNIGDILFGMIGTIGNPVIVKSDGFAIKNVALIKEKKELMNTFMIHVLSSTNIKKQFYRLNTGNTQKFISLGLIRSLKIKFPSIAEQQKIASFLSTIDKKIEITSAQLQKTREFKKGLLQQMFV